MDICIRSYSIQHPLTGREVAWEVDHWIQPRPCQAVTGKIPNTVDLHTLVLCRIISQEACYTASRVGTRYFSKDWEGRLWRHRRDPRGAFQRWTGPKKATFFCQGKKRRHGSPIGRWGGFFLELDVVCGVLWCVVPRITSSAETYHGGREKLASVGQEQASFC